MSLGIVSGISLGFLAIGTFVSVYIYSKCRGKDKDAQPSANDYRVDSTCKAENRPILETYGLSIVISISINL